MRATHFQCQLVVFLTLCGCSRTARQVSDGPVVKTEGGAIQGLIVDEVATWKSVPYAEPPIDELRWRAPRPVKSWSGVRYAKDFGRACMQVDPVLKSEDCLTLNIWRPAEMDEPLPVLVWIHGGALVQGQSAFYPGDLLAKQGLVVVGMNYRLGRLGFFAHPAITAESPDEVHGNYGYLDQIAALQWVKRNISTFGGDPGKVTIAGESAGAGSVLVHLTSPLSRGLFHRAILQSPAIPGPRESVASLTEFDEAEKMGLEYAKSVGVAGDGQEALDVLRSLQAKIFTEKASAGEVVGSIIRERGRTGVPGPIRDGKLVVQSPEEALEQGRQAMVPVIVGANSLDLGVGSPRNKTELFARFGSDAAQARKLYDPDGDLELYRVTEQAAGDRAMREPARHLARAMARAGQQVWLYRFGYVAESFRWKFRGAGPAGEIPYVFDLPPAVVDPDADNDEDKKMGKLASGYWVSFVKTGNPNGGERPRWPRYLLQEDRIGKFTNKGFSAGADPIEKRLDLWEKVSRMRREPQISKVRLGMMASR